MLEQLLDSRRPREVRAGAPARVRLGDGWVDGPVELFDELVRLFPPLFPTLEAEDPDAALEAGCVPGLRELRLHDGTVWRWNRPVYDVQAGCPQLRIENRVLPSGPTAVDMVANATFYYGLVRAIVDSDDAPSSQMPFAAAERDRPRDEDIYGAAEGIRPPTGEGPSTIVPQNGGALYHKGVVPQNGWDIELEICSAALFLSKLRFT